MSNKASDQLHKLIKSMSKPEKRYFKVFSSRHIIGDENNYQTLFDAIDKLDDYDEEKLMKKFKDKVFVQRFSIAKNRLYNALLKSLDSFHANSSVEAQLHRQVHSAEILYNKSLYDQSLKVLHSARKVAEKHEILHLLAEISKWEKRILEKNNYDDIQDEAQLNEILEKDIEVNEKLRIHSELWNIKSRLFSQLYRQGKVRSESETKMFERILHDAKSKWSGKEIGIENEYMLQHISSAYHFALGQYAECYPYLKQNIALIESNPHLFEEEPGIYLSVLSNTIYVGMRMGEWKEAFQYLEQLRAYPATLAERMNEDLEIRLFALGKSTELTLYAQSGEFEKGLEMIPEIKLGLGAFDEHLSNVRKAHFYFNIAVIYFGLEQYHEALKWVNKLLNNVDIDKTKDIHCIAQILNLVIHLELGNKDLLPYTLRSTQRFLATRNKVYEFENVMLSFVNEMLKKRSSKNPENQYQQLIGELEALRKNPFEQFVFEYFDFLAWAKSKQNGKKFREQLAA